MSMSKENKKKLTAGATAAVLILALGLSGTFAKYVGDDSEDEDNIQGDVTVAMRLHDDYNSVSANANPAMTNINRDIYVENTGQASLYVRVRLNEYMDYADRALISGTSRDDKTSWKPHLPSGTSKEECATGIHDYFSWTMGGATRYNRGIKNRYSGGNDNLNAATAQDTLTASVITMEEYAAMSAEEKEAVTNTWLLDEDGYAYWSEKIPGVSEDGSTVATGLLLDQITNTGNIDDSFFYGIHAKAEGITETDLISWLNGSAPTGESEKANRASTTAVEFLKRLSENYVEITTEMTDAATYDADHDGFLTRKEYNTWRAEHPATP